MRTRTIIALWLALAAPGLAAEDRPAEPVEDAALVDQAEVRYVPLDPSFVTNFGGSDNGRLQFLRAEVSVRVDSQEASSAVLYHLPALRHAIVMLLSRQEEASVSTSTGREALRGEALAELRAILEAEEGKPYIEDVLFTDFIVQR
ncbi:MAG TPA: flagellar basal body-associated FliL family protein [Pseudomonadales bacterium]